MGTKTILSLEEFERLPDNGMRHELNKGELVEVPPPESGHSKIARNLAKILSLGVGEEIGYVYVEAGYRLSEAPLTVR
jgi:Uma2 family endonuclease